MLAVICCVVAVGIARGASVQPGIADEQEARAICSTCHRYPAPDILPRDAWPDSIARMTLFRVGQSVPTVEGGAWHAW
jgi:hypothetical protein